MCASFLEGNIFSVNPRPPAFDYDILYEHPVLAESASPRILLPSIAKVSHPA